LQNRRDIYKEENIIVGDGVLDVPIL